jgi:cytoskeletal protein CcmA (bactofilin family)
MFSKQKNKNIINDGKSRIASVIAKDVTITGKLSSESGLRIEGKFEGELNIKGLLVIGEDAIVTCKDLYAARVIIAGQVHGTTHADKVEIRPTGKVWGDIESQTFTIEEGAFMHGKVNMKEKESPPALEEQQTEKKP